MGTKLYVGNLNFRTTDGTLAAAFADMGFTPVSVQVIQDRETGRSRGFAFVEMATGDEAVAALQKMQGKDVEGRALNVTEARERDRSGPGPSTGPRMGPRIGPPVNAGSRPQMAPRPSFGGSGGGGGGGDQGFRPRGPSQDFSRPAYPVRHMDPQPHPDLLDPSAAKEGRNRDSRRERREYRGNKHEERDDDDDY